MNKKDEEYSFDTKFLWPAWVPSCWWSGVFVEHFVCILDFTQLLDQEWYDVLSAYRPICEWERVKKLWTARKAKTRDIEFLLTNNFLNILGDEIVIWNRWLCYLFALKFKTCWSLSRSEGLLHPLVIECRLLTQLATEFHVHERELTSFVNLLSTAFSVFFCHYSHPPISALLLFCWLAFVGWKLKFDFANIGWDWQWVYIYIYFMVYIWESKFCNSIIKALVHSFVL